MSLFAIAFAHFLYYVAIAFGIITALLIAVGLIVYLNVVIKNIHRWISEFRRERRLRRETVVGCAAAAAAQEGGDVEMDAVPRIEVSSLGVGGEGGAVATEKCRYSGGL